MKAFDKMTAVELSQELRRYAGDKSTEAARCVREAADRLLMLGRICAREQEQHHGG